MSFESVYPKLQKRLGPFYAEDFLRRQADLADRINRLKAEKNAVILVHNYMDPVMYYAIADFAGDSLELSRKAAATDRDVIVFCGVHFMAETAKILSPDKQVLIPAEGAGCSLAESIRAEDIQRLRAEFPGIPVVTYVNTYADVKAESDICCTSGNAVAVLDALDAETVIFLPDRNLAINSARKAGKNILFPDTDAKGELNNVEMIGWQGACEVHERFLVDDIRNAREQYPGIKVLTHPESPPEVAEQVDYCGGTTGMMKYVAQSEATRFLIMTECSMTGILQAAHPDREFISMCSIRCPHMNRITMERVLEALEHGQFDVQVETTIAQRARKAVERMIEIG